jgi:UDP-N-acetylglucosamine--N-acetylmuramyl-(pentapeptide) pyrophosphoryl-undecaprenol N-acetylglucosamine transferase
MGKRKYLLTGGGTGGHVTPAIAIACELRNRDPEAQLLYVGSRAGKEADIVPRYDIDLVFVQTHQWAFARPWHLARFCYRMGLGVLKGMWLLLRHRPDAVIGTGGYVAAPLVFANVILRKLGLSKARTVVHEQNMTPGKLNALVGRAADLVLTSFAATKRFFDRAIYVGYPVRSEIRTQDRTESKKRLGMDEATQLVFAFGGSVGARTINRAIIDALPLLAKRDALKIVHVAGKGLTGYDPVADCDERMRATGMAKDDLGGWYERREFIDGIADYYGAADLIVGRAGAGTLAELCASGRPSVLIPKANLAGDHQVMNALELVRAGASMIAYEGVVTTDGHNEEHVDGSALAEMIGDLLDDSDKLLRMAHAAESMATPESLRVTADVIERLVSGDELDLAHDGLPTPAPSPTTLTDLARLSGESLKDRAEKLASDLRDTMVVPGADAPTTDEVAAKMAGDEAFQYLRYRATGSLASPSWRIRNAGVKLVGVLLMRDRLPVLLEMMTDRRPAPLLHRLLGGDYIHNGFVRRNTTVAIGQLGVYDDGVSDALLGGLSDPYFEVRSASATAIARLARSAPDDPAMTEALLVASRDDSFEVVAAATVALGVVGTVEAVGDRLRELVREDNWKIRSAVLQAYDTLLARGEPVETAALVGELDEMMVTSTGFVPTFALKTAVAALGARIGRRDEGGN